MRCEICGKEIKTSRFMNGNICSDECFKRKFWAEKIEVYENDKNSVVIDGHMFYIGNEYSSSFRGFCGRLFRIQKKCGEIIHTTNLWSNGEVPKYMRDILRDNAKFID